MKYPQGFAIVLTSSSTSNLIGNKGSGLGYDGINNGIAFEFDFIRQSEKEDYKKPHFSIHYNIKGEISSKSEKTCTDICNKILPNFYDNTIDDYKKNMIFEIEIIGKKLIVKTNTGKILVEVSKFEAFSQLLEQEEVFIGITASMNQNKKVNIDDFSLSEISVMEKGELVLSKSVFSAGETISLLFSIKSTCKELLKIYPNEYTSNNGNNNTNLSLIINNDIEEPSKIVFNFSDSDTNLRLDISRTKSGTYTALIKFNDNYSSPVQFTVTAGEVQRLEICNEKETVIDNIYLNPNLKQEKEKFNISLCSYDQYNNSRKIDYSSGAKNLIKILYPYYFTGNSELNFDIKKENIIYMVPFSTFGQYEIFNESFKQSPRRFFNLTVNRISPENSDATILYGKHLINPEKTKSVTLRLKLRDEFGRDIPNRIIEEMKCDFSGSYIENAELSSSNIDVQFEKNDIIYLVYSFTNLGTGKYTFIPKIKCEGDEYNLTLKCSETEDDENSIYDKCAFYVNSGEVNPNKIRLYSDFLNDYIHFDNNNEKNQDLLISLDENDNKKITEINLLDKSDYPMIDPTEYDITCKLGDITLTTKKIGYSIAFLLGENSSRDQFDITKDLKLSININKGSEYSSYEVGIKFVSVDNILNNMYGKTGKIDILPLYQQENYTIEATENILLFEVYRINTETNYLIKDSVVRNTNLEMKIKIDGKEYNNVTFVEKEYSVLIYTDLLKKVGTHTISLYDNNEKKFENLEIKVIPSGEVKKLFDEENPDIEDSIETRIEMKDDYKFLLLYDKYDNKIKDNKAILAFSKFEIISHGLKAKMNMNGKMFIYKENDSIEEISIKIILPSGKIYEIFKNPPKIDIKLNPHKTYGLLNMTTSINIETPVSINLYLFDDNGNPMESKLLLESDIENFDVYAIEKFGNSKKFYSLEKKEKSENNILKCSTEITLTGEYEIKIFYNNIYIPCKACHFNIFEDSPSAKIDYQNTRLYILGNKRKIPVFSEKAENKQLLVNSKNLVINLQFYDKYFNEIAVSTQYSLSLYHAERRNEINVKLCNYGNSKLEGKQFYHVCSDQLTKFKNLQNGDYRIEVNGKIFSLYVSNQETDLRDSIPKRAIYHQYENETFSTTDSVTSLIVDLRNSNNMRINIDNNILNNQIDVKLKKNNEYVNQNDYKINKLLGPDNGLFTLIMNIKKIGQYSLEIYYNNEKIDSRNIKINISCGAINNLEELENPKYFSGIGTYTFFKVLDINSQICDKNSNNSFNIFNNEDYIQNLITIKDSKDSIYYSTTKYYNHLKGVLSVIISSQINNDVIISSGILDFSYDVQQAELSKEKINKEYLYVKLDQDNKKVKLSMLKQNYEPYTDSEFTLKNNEKLTLSILKTLNDETIILNEYEFNDNIKGFDFSNQDISSSGDYFFVVYLNGEVVPCGECHIKVEDNINLISIKNTKIYLKNGYNKYLEIKEGVKNYIYRTRFPFFKINFQTSNNNLVRITESEITSKYNIRLYTDNGDLSTNTVVNNYNGNVYLKLLEDGRKEYLKLSTQKRILYLSIKDNNSGEEIKLEFILFNEYSSNKSDYEKCNLGAQPVIVNFQNSYIIRADEYKDIEVYLDGCSEIVNKLDDPKFELDIIGYDTSQIMSVIPADTYGNFILLVNYEKTISTPSTAYIKYLNGKSENFQLSVLAGYNIENINLTEDESLGEANTNYKYAYILMELRDNKNNLISNLGRNLFFNDINILNIIDSNNNNLPYKLSFDDEKKKFRVEIPINGNGEISINNKINNNMKLIINEAKIYRNNNFNMVVNQDKDYTFTINFLDELYKKIDNPKYFSINDLSFIYITENSVTQEFYSTKIFSNFEYSKNTINLKLDKSIPIYNSYSFIPVLSGFSQICHNCLKKNTYNNYIHSIHNNLYYPHSLDKDIYLQKKYEYPLFIYFSSNEMTISSDPNIMTNVNIVGNYNYYIFGLTNNEKKDIKLEFKTLGKTLNIKFNDEKVNIDTYTKEMEIKIEKYYYNYISFISGNNGKLLDLYFYVDIRNNINSNPVYISNEFSSNLLSGYSDNKTLIEYLNIFQTDINGTYLVIIPRNKLINGKYTFNFTNNNPVSSDNYLNTIAFNSLGAFPNIILLNNKEMIYKNLIKYDLIGHNNNSELICDERLNIYIEPKSTAKFIKGDYVNKDNNNELTINSCKLYIEFIGDINIITNIGDGFLSELTNSDNSIYNINPHYSEININPNIIIFGNESLNILFNEHSSDDLSFSKDEMPVNKGLKILRYLTSTKYELKQDVNGLFSSEYIFTPTQFKMTTLDSYIFIGSISNNYINEPVFVSYIKKKQEIVDHFSVKYFEDNLWTSIDDLITPNNKTENAISIKYPFKISLKLVDQNDSFVKAENGKLKVSVISDKINRAYYDEFDLEVKQINDYEFIIEPNISNIDNLIHMETKNENNKFYISFIYDTNIKYYVLINSKNENNLHPRVSKKGYGIPKKVLDESYSLINEYESESTFYINKNEPNSEIYCLVNSNELLFNGNIDPNKMKCYTNGKQCENVEIVNSYRGCIKIGAITNNDQQISLEYDGKSLNIINLSALPTSILNFELTIDKELDVEQSEDFEYKFNILNGDSILDIQNSKYFSVYLNGQKLKKSEYTFSPSNKEIRITSKLFSSTLVPEKNISVIYNRGNLESESEVGLVKIKIIQNKYSYEAGFKYNAQVPTHFKAGEIPFFYLIIKDTNLACYYGNENRLEDLKYIFGQLKETSKTISFNIDLENSSVKLDDIAGCEYIYLLKADTSITHSGLFDVDIYDDNHRITSDSFIVQMYIAPGDFFYRNTVLEGDKNVSVGDSFNLYFSTQDENENQPNYYDIIEHFQIKLINVKTNKEINETSIKYKKMKVSEDNDKIEITMTITESGIYNVKAIYNDKELALKTTTFLLTINHKECSFNNPQLTISKIDNRNNIFYSGEEVEINIYCKDIYGNLIENPGKENFKAIIDNNGNLITSEHIFDQIHKIYFTTENEGDYDIQILLNGKDYSDSIKIKVEKFSENLFMCMDKKQVTNIKDCSDETNQYKDLIINIEGKDNICEDDLNFNEGNFFYCKKDGEFICTYNTSYCDCDENYEKINGYCYPIESGPIDLVNKNKNKANCLSILAGQGITSAFQCKDGSCRLKQEDCNTIFECPLGFKSCGNNCILLNQKCELKNNCGDNEVLCWDYTCASSYSLCPTRKTCPEGKILCPDGTCQNSGHCPQPISRNCPIEKPIQCPDFNCVEDKNDCNKNKVCPPGLSLCEDDICRDKCEIIDDKKYKCSNGLFVNNSQLCPSEMQCPNSWIKCPQGGCAQSQESCKFIQGYKNLVCPKNKPILCPDYECVSTFSSCKKNYPICPPHKPYQCWNNECRKSFSECPTEISCPPNSPLLCTNGLCVNSINNCHEKNKENYALCKKEGKLDPNKVRCFDGTCVNSLELCPTYSYCGKEKIKCWNGACVDSITNCLSSDSLPQCEEPLSYRCSDGSCRKDIYSCSTISVCPNSLPVKCFDNSCRATIDECPEYHSCGINKVNCPDGTCAKSYDECNTIVTCDPNNPFLCYDGSCRAQLEECPSPPSCGNKNVQCPNGSCSTSRQFCKFFSACEAKTPIRCEMNICTDDLNNCQNNRQCPVGYVMCSNGDCKIMSSLCEENICPSNAPYRCPEGVCVLNKTYCDNILNGCPYNAQIKCDDGTCVKDKKLCVDYTKRKDIDPTDFCPDGSNINLQENKECPLENGCPKDKDLKCADGTCINSTLSVCPPVYCPRQKPIKCLNGLCVVKSSDCLSISNNDDFLEDGLIMCLDGRKVPSYDYCRPIFECPEGYIKCLDNTCRLNKDYCPQFIQCPKERPYRTKDNENEFCSKYNETEAFIYCPKNYSKCENTGECIETEEYMKGKCPEPLSQIGCPKINQIRCDNGRCMNSEEECLLASKACPDDEKPFLCTNGICVSNLSLCQDDDNKNCGEGFIRCYNGRCVEDNEESYLEKCTNEIGCPLNKPYRCSNGECVSSQRKCEIISENNNTIILNTICDSSKPYLCSDYSCESDYSFCKLTIPCPEGLHKCFNGYCVEKEKDCEQYKNYCPQSNPIRCPSGSCTTNILKCPESFPKESCQEGEFYCMRLGKCVKKKSECLINYKKNNNFNKKNEFLFLKLSENLCYDGTIAENGEKCPIVPSCKVGQFRCENGGCAYNKSLCIVDDEYKCEPGEQKCPDGLCHKNCNEVAYQGCLVGEYLCSNGMCVDSEVSCAGYSMCEDPSVPYRCINGECKSDITLCPEVEKLSSVRNISYSFNKDNKIEFDFAFDPKGRSIGKLIIPSKGIKLNKNYSKINIEEFSASLVLNDTLYNNTPEFLFDISNGIEGSEGVLNFENAIMSPIFKFFSEDLSEIKFNIPALLVLEHNAYTSSELFYYDYCLAKLSNYDIKNDKLNYNGNSKWECIQRQEREGQNEFELNDFGVYAILLNPSRDKIDYWKGKSKNILYDNFIYILIFIIILFFFGLIVFYVFKRVMRYRGKYKAKLAKIEHLNQQKENYKQMQTDVFGQSLGDNLIGIVYSKNPGFNEEDEEMKEGDGMNDEIEEIQRKCRNLELQNEKLQENLEKLENDYKQVNNEIEQIKNNQQ